MTDFEDKDFLSQARETIGHLSQVVGAPSAPDQDQHHGLHWAGFDADVPLSAPSAPDSAVRELLEELELYIKSAVKYERGDADFVKSPPAGFLKKVRAALSPAAAGKKEQP